VERSYGLVPNELTGWSGAMLAEGRFGLTGWSGAVLRGSSAAVLSDRLARSHRRARPTRAKTEAERGSKATTESNPWSRGLFHRTRSTSPCEDGGRWRRPTLRRGS